MQRPAVWDIHCSGLLPAPSFEAGVLLWGWVCPGSKHGGLRDPSPSWRLRATLSHIIQRAETEVLHHLGAGRLSSSLVDATSQHIPTWLPVLSSLLSARKTRDGGHLSGPHLTPDLSSPVPCGGHREGFSLGGTCLTLSRGQLGWAVGRGQPRGLSGPHSILCPML